MCLRGTSLKCLLLKKKKKKLCGSPPPFGKALVKDSFSLFHPQHAPQIIAPAPAGLLWGFAVRLLPPFSHALLLSPLTPFPATTLSENQLCKVFIRQTIAEVALRGTKSSLSESLAASERIHRAGPAGLNTQRGTVKEERERGRESRPCSG